VNTQLSISDPRYNLREIVKQLTLLEQHLLERGKYCPDCISKHLLTIEALADECQNLDARQDWVAPALGVGQQARAWAHAFAAGAEPHAIGQRVRAFRKAFAPKFLDPSYGALEWAGADVEEEIGFWEQLHDNMTRRVAGIPVWLGLLAAGGASWWLYRMEDK